MSFKDSLSKIVAAYFIFWYWLNIENNAVKYFKVTKSMKAYENDKFS